MQWERINTKVPSPWHSFLVASILQTYLLKNTKTRNILPPFVTSYCPHQLHLQNWIVQFNNHSLFQGCIYRGVLEPKIYISTYKALYFGFFFQNLRPFISSCRFLATFIAYLPKITHKFLFIQCFWSLSLHWWGPCIPLLDILVHSFWFQLSLRLNLKTWKVNISYIICKHLI